jgi:3-phenylpropionate/trans-cinnamate dioxygenase ferredoxin reductase subunit
VLDPAARVVIVGAGFAGGNVAAALREEGFRGRVVLIGAEPGVPFGRPPLSKTYLRSEEALDGWLVKAAAWYEANDVERHPETVVAGVDTAAHDVVLADGSHIPWDHLVLCTGGRPRRTSIPGTDLPGVHVLRTIADCEAIRRAVRPGGRAVVLGMGFIGSEVAASLRQLGMAVTAVLRGTAPLENVLGAEIGAVMAGIHRDHGVELLTGDSIVRLEGGGTVQRAVTERGVRIDCDLAVIGAGIEPDLDVLNGTPIELDNGILVDSQCRTNVAGIHAAGDVANHLHPLFGRVRVEHYNNAEKMGRYVARALLGDTSPYDYVHTFWSDQFEHSLEYAGHVSHWDQLVFRGSPESRRFLAFYLQSGILKAAAGLNRGGDPELDVDGELSACKQLVAARATLSPAVLTDESADLRSLAASLTR